MEIYLIRHTTPRIEKGTCYGQSDLDVTESFAEEVAHLQQHLPETVEKVYSSPLRRCKLLAEELFAGQPIHFANELKEIHCGEWELKSWDAIERAHLDRWMADVVNERIPGGESYQDLYHRTSRWFESLPPLGSVAIVSHGGVIRSLLAHINDVSIEESFDAFSLHYGCVIRLHRQDARFQHTVLHNPYRGVEQHRPSFY